MGRSNGTYSESRAGNRNRGRLTVTTPDQAMATLIATRNWLLDITSGRHKLNTKTEIRREARLLLKHYPYLTQDMRITTPEED